MGRQLHYTIILCIPQYISSYERHIVLIYTEVGIYKYEEFHIEKKSINKTAIATPIFSMDYLHFTYRIKVHSLPVVGGTGTELKLKYCYVCEEERYS